jgi:glycosyltransferase involved in cell wall biosynthesis
MEDPARRREVLAVLREARTIVVPTNVLADRIREVFPDATEKTTIVPKGILLGEAPWPLRERLDLRPSDVVFFLPAGLRRLKGLDFLVDALGALAQESTTLRLVVAGPIIEREFADPFLASLSALRWARYAGVIPPEAMGSAYAGVDVVVNASMSEGMANSVLEGMAAGRAVLAADIPGNRAVIDPGITGLLYASASAVDFQRQARRLRDDPVLRRDLGRRAQEAVLPAHSVERETEAMVEIYRRVAGPRWGRSRPSRPESL